MTDAAHRLVSPPALGAQVAVARAHAWWKAAIASGNLDAAAEAAAPALDLNVPLGPGLTRLHEMRLWHVDSLMRQGRPEAAEAALDRIESIHQASHHSRFLRARLRYFRGDFDGAAAACGEAVILLPLTKKPSAQYSAIIRFWSDSLCLAGRHQDARRLLERALAFKNPWTTEDIKALRQTVVDDAGLEDFRAFLGPYFSFAGVRSRAALYHYSMACRDLGHYAQAELAIRQRYVTAARLVPFGHWPPPVEKKTWVPDARTTLADLKAVMEAAGVEFFLISGTLLGAVRERDILGHDKDIDVGVMDEAGLDKAGLETALRQSGRFSVKPYQVPTLLRVQHASGVMIDIFWHRDEDGLIVHEGMKSKWWNAPFRLVDVPFLGDTYRGPDNFSRYLGENYGDWETPDAEFETFVDTPNMVVTSEGEIVWYFYCKLFDYHNQGRVAQFRKVGEALRRIRPGDTKVHAMIAETLAAQGLTSVFVDEEPLEELVFDPLDDDRMVVADDSEPGRTEPSDDAASDDTEAEEEMEEVEATDRDEDA